MRVLSAAAGITTKDGSTKISVISGALFRCPAAAALAKAGQGWNSKYVAVIILELCAVNRQRRRWDKLVLWMVVSETWGCST